MNLLSYFAYDRKFHVDCFLECAMMDHLYFVGMDEGTENGGTRHSHAHTYASNAHLHSHIRMCTNSRIHRNEPREKLQRCNTKVCTFHFITHPCNTGRTHIPTQWSTAFMWMWMLKLECVLMKLGVALCLGILSYECACLCRHRSHHRRRHCHCRRRYRRCRCSCCCCCCCCCIPHICRL